MWQKVAITVIGFAITGTMAFMGYALVFRLPEAEGQIATEKLLRENALVEINRRLGVLETNSTAMLGILTQQPRPIKHRRQVIYETSQ